MWMGYKYKKCGWGTTIKDVDGTIIRNVNGNT